MLGTLRLILALAVAASHAGFYPGGLNPGVAAVVGFYLISGYVMTGLQQRHYPGPAHAPGFYADRLIRILPQYFFYATLTLFWQLSTQTTTLFLQAAPTTIELINNLLIVPLNYYMINNADRFTLIPPAWSLAAEIQFYLIAPLLLLWPRRLIATSVFSLSILVLAFTARIDSDWYGYRLLPGVLFFFILGALLQHLHRAGRQATAMLLVIGTLLVAMLSAYTLRQNQLLYRPYNQEILIGLCLALPLLHALGLCKRRRWDDLLGDLSYGVFLNHFLILWLIYPKGVSKLEFFVFLACSITLSFVTQRSIEQPFLRWRQNMRKTNA